LKSEQDVRNEIDATVRTLDNYQKAYKEGKIPFDVLKVEFTDKTATIQALKWVLGENERFD
jgi:hypothetical protein